MRVEVDTSDGPKLGRTFGDGLLGNDAAALVDVTYDVDTNCPFSLFTQYITRD